MERKRVLKIDQNGRPAIEEQEIIVEIELSDEQHRRLEKATGKKLDKKLKLTPSELTLLFDPDQHDRTVGASV